MLGLGMGCYRGYMHGGGITRLVVVVVAAAVGPQRPFTGRIEGRTTTGDNDVEKVEK